MAIVSTFSLESNKQIKINFNGGDLSSDGGLLLIKEFAARIGLTRLVKQFFKTNDPASFRIHTDSDNLMQVVYQIIAAYFEDDCADELTSDPVFAAVLEKEALWSNVAHVHIHRYHVGGSGALSGRSVLLRPRQDGKFHQGREIRI